MFLVLDDIKTDYEDTMKLYDYSALIPIIEGANGVNTDWYGSKLNMDSDGTVIAAGNQKLHEQSLILLGKRKSSWLSSR